MFRRSNRQVPFQSTKCSDLNSRTIDPKPPFKTGGDNILAAKLNTETTNDEDLTNDKSTIYSRRKNSIRRISLNRVHSLARPKLIQKFKTGWKEFHNMNGTVSDIADEANSTKESTTKEYRGVIYQSEINPKPSALRVYDEDSTTLPLQVKKGSFYNRTEKSYFLKFGSTEKIAEINNTIEPVVNNRILYFIDIPCYFSLSSILSQVYGGPLERITNSSTYFENSAEGTKTKKQLVSNRVELHFMEPEHAQKFYKYTQLNRFIINGYICRPEWTSYARRPMPFYVTGYMVYRNARRILKLIQFDSMLSHASRGGYVLDLPSIRTDFGFFGTLVSITPLLGSPLVSKAFMLAIEYTDVRYAIAAKYAFDNGKSLSDYKAHWKLEYHKDPTDRPCPALL